MSARPLAWLALLFAALGAGCQAGAPPATTATSDQALTGADAGTGSTGATYGPLPDLCPDGQQIVCTAGGCSCGVAPSAPATCDAQTECTGDGDCGDGHCCYHGSCVARDGNCACGDTAMTQSSSSSPGCPGSGSFVQMLKDQAQAYCGTSAPMFGDQCTELGQCVGTAVFDSTSVQCLDGGSGSGSGGFTESGMVATVCMHCDDSAPSDAPPDNEDECDDLQVQIANKKTEINTKQLDAKYLADGIAKLDAAIANTNNYIASLQDAESKVIAGTFGDNILVTTAGQSTKFVTDIYGGAKLVTSAQQAACLTQRAFCRTNLVGAVPQYSWKNVVLSKKAWGEVYEPAAQFGLAKVAGGVAGGQCPADKPDDSWFSWWPGLSSGKWFVGCFTKQYVIDEIGENRINAINNRNELTQKRDGMKQQRDQVLIDIGTLQAQLKTLQDQYDATCGCGADAGDGGGAGSGSG